MEKNLIEALLYLLQEVDESTADHVRRTSVYVGIIGEQLLKDGSYKDEISPEYVRRLEKASLLHDIGKISIPDSVLKKTGKYTPEEYDIMKRHTVIGGNFIKTLGFSSDLMKEAYNIALLHHERWNGNGYPLGISKTSIPLSARITGVADVLDACLSKRCYKDSLTYTETSGIISEGKGKDFDPIIVDAFFKAEEEIKVALNDFLK